jgi:hypothetical protein
MQCLCNKEYIINYLKTRVRIYYVLCTDPSTRTKTESFGDFYAANYIMPVIVVPRRIELR